MSARTRLPVLLVLSMLLSDIEAYRILVWYPVPVKSMCSLGEAYVRILIDAGHEVTYVSSYPLAENVPQKNFRQFDVSPNNRMIEEDDFLKISYIMEHGPPESDVHYYQTWAYTVAEKTFSYPHIKDFLERTDEHFDLVLADFYESELFSSLAALYECPLVWGWSMGPHWIVFRLVDELTNPSYTVDYLSYNVPPLSFAQRVEELWAQIRWHYHKLLFTMPKEEALYKKVFEPLFLKRGRELVDYKEFIYNSSLVLLNDFNVGGNVPSLPQSVKMVGGFHMSIPTALPEELQDLMDNAKHGVIYFSMGSNWKSSSIPKHITYGLLKMFGELKQTVIWKYEDELRDVPGNVRLLKWAPQRSILAHRNLALFITHGGQLSSTEVVYFGTPAIGIPISFDQFLNVHRAVHFGYMLKVELNQDLLTNLKTAINTILTNPAYKARAKEVSAIYHDRTAPADQEVLHWIEHAVRTRGAPHLRSPALRVPWYQKLYLDLVCVLAATAGALFVAARPVLVLLLRLRARNCSSNKTSKLKSN